MVQTGEVLSHPAVCQLPIRIFAVEGEGTPNRKTATVRAERAKLLVFRGLGLSFWHAILRGRMRRRASTRSYGPSPLATPSMRASHGTPPKRGPRMWCPRIRDCRMTAWNVRYARKLSEQLMELPNTAYDRVEASIDMDVSLQPR